MKSFNSIWTQVWKL